MNEKAKVQNSVRWKYKFYKGILLYCNTEGIFILERLHLVNKIGQQIYLSIGEQEGGTPSHHHYLVSWLWQILISQILMPSYVQMNRYFSKSRDPIAMTLLDPREEFSFLTTVKKENDLCVLIFRIRVSDL